MLANDLVLAACVYQQWSLNWALTAPADSMSCTCGHRRPVKQSMQAQPYIARSEDMPAGQHSNGYGILAGFVSYRGDDSGLDGFLAEPNDGRSHPGVVLIQEWWGIEPHIKELAERLAGEGYVVLAPDLYHGEVVTEPDEAQKAVMKLNLEAAVQEIRHGIDYLQRRDNVSPKQVGLVGFCLGGLLAWRVANAAEPRASR